MSNIEIHKIGITDVGTDAIVNAANEGLWAGSGVCGAIFDAAGMEQLTQACNAIGHCDTGSAVITPGFRLSKYIIHAVGPRWGGDESKVKKQLYSCCQAALKLAIDNGCKSIGFPLISSGIFGVPMEIAWRKALQACIDFKGNIDIVFAVLKDDVLSAGKRTLDELITKKALDQPVVDATSMIIFHDADKEYGFLSNWFLSDFYVDGICFTSVEQYLMYHKAILFKDTAMAKAILNTSDPEKIKEYGQNVKPYNGTIWNGTRQVVLYRGLINKFSQNPSLRAQLLATGDSILVEGTLGDKIYANGMKRTDPDRYDMNKWPGQNLLGFTLMEVRKDLKG